jgi:hypothetical protein
MNPYIEKKNHKNRAGGMAQGVGLEFKPQYHKKKKKGCYTVSPLYLWVP